MNRNDPRHVTVEPLPSPPGVVSAADVVWVEDAAVEVHRLSPAGGAVSGEVVFFHGWGLGPRSYCETVGQLALHGFDVVMPAMPGYGASDHLPGRVDVNSMVPRVAAHLSQALREDDVLSGRLLVGHSLGAGVAALTAEAEEQPSGVVMLSPIGGDAGALSWVRALASLGGEVQHSTVERAREALPAFARAFGRTVATGIAAKRTDLVDVVTRVADRTDVTIVTATEDRVTPAGPLLGLPTVRYRSVPGTHGWVLSDVAEAASEVRLHQFDAARRR